MRTTILLIAAAGSLWAQARPGARIELQRTVHEADAAKVEVARLINGPAVKNAPYSAEAVTEIVQVLGDGNRIENRSSTKIFRDSEGRERREESDGSVFISDPVEGTNFTLRTDTKVAHRGGKFFVLGTRVEGVFEGVAWTPEISAQKLVIHSSETQTPVEEKLGTRLIEGVQAEGARSTVTIPAGEIGNLRPIEVVDERWYSPELQVIVYSRHSDPRTGTNEYRLINIQRGEQPRTLFEVPDDYSVPENLKQNVIRLNVR